MVCLIFVISDITMTHQTIRYSPQLRLISQISTHLNLLPPTKLLMPGGFPTPLFIRPPTIREGRVRMLLEMRLCNKKETPSIFEILYLILAYNIIDKWLFSCFSSREVCWCQVNILLLRKISFMPRFRLTPWIVCITLNLLLYHGTSTWKHFKNY